jgi:hypothetical protein
MGAGLFIWIVGYCGTMLIVLLFMTPKNKASIKRLMLSVTIFYLLIAIFVLLTSTSGVDAVKSV